MLVKMIPMGGN